GCVLLVQQGAVRLEQPHVLALTTGDREELLEQTGLAQRPLPGVDVEHAALVTSGPRRVPFVHDGFDPVQVQHAGEGQAAHPAAALDVGPMRLYGYIATKEELLDLMVDAVYAEIRPAGDGWREVLRSLAETTRKAAHRHEWLADLLGGRAQLGPNTMAGGEAV